MVHKVHCGDLFRDLGLHLRPSRKLQDQECGEAGHTTLAMPGPVDGCGGLGVARKALQWAQETQGSNTACA